MIYWRCFEYYEVVTQLNANKASVSRENVHIMDFIDLPKKWKESQINMNETLGQLNM